MNRSQTISAVIVQLAVVLLPMMGIKVGSDQLTVAIQTITVIATGLWIWMRRFQEGDVTLLGARKATYGD